MLNLEKFVEEDLDAFDASVVATVDLGSFAVWLLDKETDKVVGPIAKLHRAAFAFASVVVGGLGSLVVRHIFYHRLAGTTAAPGPLDLMANEFFLLSFSYFKYCK